LAFSDVLRCFLEESQNDQMEYATRHRDKNQGPHRYPLLIASERVNRIRKQQGFPPNCSTLESLSQNRYLDEVGCREDLDFQSGLDFSGLDGFIMVYQGSPWFIIYPTEPLNI
jgi:hypothetical protein